MLCAFIFLPLNNKEAGLLEEAQTDTAAEKTAKTALRARFTAFEISVDFVASLRHDRDAIDTANGHNQTQVQDGVENTALIGKLLGEINVEVDFLDTIMGNKYELQPEKLRAWESASRVERAPVRAKKDKPASTHAPAPTLPQPAPTP